MGFGVLKPLTALPPYILQNQRLKQLRARLINLLIGDKCNTTEEFAAMALRQQSDLMTRLTEYDAAIDAEEVDERPVAVGADDQIAPGHVRPNFIFRMEGGKEIQIDTRDGTRTVL